MLFPDTYEVNPAGHMAVGGCDLGDLAREYGTPLYVYDEATIRNRARAYRDGMRAAYGGESLVCYAGKAYSAPWLLRGYGLLAAAILAPPGKAELALRVRHLSQTRTEASVWWSIRFAT